MKIHFLEKCCDISRAYLDTIGLAEPHEFTENIDEADVICVIGCGYVKPRIDNTLDTIYEALKDKRKDTHLSVFGCPTNFEEFSNIVKTLPEVEYVGIGSGIQMQDELVKYLKNILGEDKVFRTELGCSYKTPYRVNLVIQDGCSNRCKFCKSNYLNLHLRSMPFDYLTEYLKYLVQDGLKEVNITGLNTTAYGTDLCKKYRLIDIIRFISAFREIESIFLDSMCLESIDNELLNEIIHNKKIKRIMIPIQSMDDRILKLMGRKYTAEDITRILTYISEYRPDIFLETIIMTTFPTETIETAERNIRLIEKIKIHNPTLSIYHQGKNVSSLPSEKLPQMTDEERYDILRYYSNFMIPIIEDQRRELLSHPLEGRLSHRSDEFDWYSTSYRFTTNELMVKCKRNASIDDGELALIQSDFVESNPNLIYTTNPQPTSGRVLKKLK